MKRLEAAALFAALVVAFAVGADKPRSAPPADGQSSYEPRSAPGAGQKLLEKFVGDWDVAKTFYPMRGEAVHATGQCHQTMIHGGRFLQSEFVFEQDGQKTTGLGIIGFEPKSGKFTSVWTDSRQTRMSLRQSEEPFNGKEIILVGRSLDEPNPKRRTRTVSHLEGGDRRLVHRQYMVEPDGKQRLMMELLMTRRDTSAKPGH